ncbi:MAG TPA: transcription antitermination factor NusB [Hyphomicrobiaceae bacterium]|nr:transcription antitermination factor NusB [Hyphomicrobiaceae bacterium]
MRPPPEGPMLERSAARLAAVQGLYQMDLAGTDLNAVIDQLLANPIEEAECEGEGERAGERANIDAAFLGELLRGVVRRQRDIDPIVDQQLAVGWRLARIDSILRAILRSAVFELMERHDIPARVIINEYIELAHAFFAGEEPKVVNGVLDKLARRFRPHEFAGRSGS